MNKKFVRAFALVLAALMCLSLLPLAARADEGHVCQFTPVRTEPTCGEEGYVQMTCEVCGNAGEIIEWIPPTGAHTFMDVVNDDYLFEESDNLCLRPARYWKACAVCGAAAEEAHTEALNKLYEEINQRKNNGEEHTNEEWQKITEDAVKDVDAQYTFSFGGEGHSWVSYERQEATCTSDGWEAYRQCSACGAIDGEYPRIPAKGHRWGEFAVTKEPTCTEDGSKERVCEVCGEKETVAIPALGHTWGAFTVITEPKCEEDGLQEHICEVCEATESVAIPALGHRWGAFTVTRPATCTVDGEQEHICAACGKKETEIIPAGHKWGEWAVTVEPGCYSSGERTRTCTVCGEKETEAIAPAHKWGEWVVVMEPTCYSTGEEKSTCTVCGETESRWLDMAHKYENGVCVFCGEAQPDAPAVTGTEEPAAETEETATEENYTEEHTNDTNETPANEPETKEEPADAPYEGIKNADAVKNGEVVDEAYVGNVLTAAVTPADHEYIYQWYRIAGEEIEEISGAYDKSYKLTEEDLGASVYCFVDDEEMSDATTYAVAVLPADQDPNPAPAEETAAEEAEKSNTLEEAETYAAAEMEAIGTEKVASSAETIADFAEKTGIAADPASITAQNVTPVNANGEKLDNDAVAAAGGVTFEMPLPENYKSGDDIEIYHQNSETGAWEKITNYTVIDGKVIIREQKDFSAFIVVDKNGNLVEAETFGADETGIPGLVVLIEGEERPDIYCAFKDNVLTARPEDPDFDMTGIKKQWYRTKGTGDSKEDEKIGTNSDTYTVKESDIGWAISCAFIKKIDDIEHSERSRVVYARKKVEFNVTVKGKGSVKLEEVDAITSKKGELPLPVVESGPNPIDGPHPDPVKVSTVNENTITFTYTPDAEAGFALRKSGFATTEISMQPSEKQYVVSSDDDGKTVLVLFDLIHVNAGTTPRTPEDITDYNNKTSKKALDTMLSDMSGVKAGDINYVAAIWDSDAALAENEEIGAMDGVSFDLAYPADATPTSDYTFRAYRFKSGSWTPIEEENLTYGTDKVTVKKFKEYAPVVVLAFRGVKLKFEPNGGTGSMDSISKLSGEPVTVPDSTFIAPTGKTFEGWSRTADGEVDPDCAPGKTITMGDSDITLFAKWMDGYTIKFDKNSPDAVGTVPDKHVKAGESFSLPSKTAYTLKNHEIEKWVDDDGRELEPGDQEEPTKDVTYKAKWKRTHSTISFNKNGGTGTMDDQTGPINSTITLKANAFTAPEGKIFAGWSITADGDRKYKNGETITVPEGDIPLFAVWRDKVVIHFHPKSTSEIYGGTGTGSMDDQIVPSNVETALESNDFTAPNGKAFAFWSDKQDGTGNIYLNGSTNAWTGETDLYAQWGDKITITYDPNGGEGGRKVQYAAEDTDVTLASLNASGFTRKDYKFLGWDPIATKKDNPKYQEKELVTGGFSKDTTLYAIWEQTDFVGTVLVTGSQSGIDPMGYWEETLTCEVAGEPKYMIAGYQWRRNGENIDGATSDKYVPNEEDYGKTITCAVKAYDPDDPEKKPLEPWPESNPKHIITQEIEVKEIHDDGLTLSAYKYGLMPNMTYTLNGIDQGKVILDSQNRMAFTKGGTYKFFDKDGKMVSIVEVENWYTLSYTVTNRTTTSSSSSSSSSGSKTSTSSTSTTTGGGTVRMYNGTSQLTATSVVDPNTGEVIIKANGSITTSSGSWLVREGASTDLKMVVAPSSNSYAHVSLNGSSYSSLGSGEKTITVSPMNTYKHYEIVFVNSSSSPKTADESHLGMWSALCFTSLVAASAVLTRSRRRRKNEK